MQKYVELFYLTLCQNIKNYKLLIGLAAFLITCLIIFSHLWQHVAARSNITNLDPINLLWYIAFNEWVLISIPDISMDMEHELKDGSLAYRLPRPISYIGSKFVEGAAQLILQLVALGLVTFIFTFAWTQSLPFSYGGFAIMILLGIGAGFLGLLFQMLVGLSGFWLQDTSPFSWVMEKLLFMFGGLILPLTVYPEWLQKIAFWTPFPAILGGRSALVFSMDLTNISWIVFSIILWGIIGILALRVTYSRGLQILNIQGG